MVTASEPAATALTGSALYETGQAVSDYLIFHFGDASMVLGGMPGPTSAVGFATRLVRELLDAEAIPGGGSALDIGCAVGGSSFELARTCETVLGIDYSGAFIEAGRELARNGHHPCNRVVEGSLAESVEVNVPEGIDRSRVKFETGDACGLRDDLGAFDVVLAANLLCRLAKPQEFLARLPGLVKPGGQLLLTTPFTWLDSYTPREFWLGGSPDAGRSFDALREILEPSFRMDLRADIPFLIREHARKFQYSIALGTRWIRRMSP